MDAAFEFSFNGLNMDFGIHLALDGHKVPEGLFIDIMVEKCLLLHQYMKSADKCLTLVSNVNNEKAMIKLYDRDIIHTPLIQYEISNQYDIEEQLYVLWKKARKIFKAYKVYEPLKELDHIARYYSLEAYEERMHTVVKSKP